MVKKSIPFSTLGLKLSLSGPATAKYNTCYKFQHPNPTNSPCHTRIIELGSNNTSTKLTTSVVGPQNNKEKLPGMTAKDFVPFPPRIPGTFSRLKHKKQETTYLAFRPGSNSVQYKLDSHTLGWDSFADFEQ